MAEQFAVDVNWQHPGDEPDKPEIAPILSFVSVSPVKQPIQLNGVIHFMRPSQGYGVITQMEIERDWDTYRNIANAIGKGETFSTDEANLGDLAAERLLRFSLPTIKDDEWEGIAPEDKTSLLTLFFEITELTRAKREQAAAALIPRSVSTSRITDPNSPGSTG